MRRALVAVFMAATVGACSSGARKTVAPVDATPSSTTTTSPTAPAMPTREADRNGLHYTLTLSTPTVVQLGIVRVQLQVDNHTAHAAPLGQCVLGSIVVTAIRSARPPLGYSCGPGITVGPNRSYTYIARTVAPLEPGNYVLWPQPLVRDAPPPSLLAPLPLHVVANTKTDRTATCTRQDLDARGVVPMPTPQFVTRHTPITGIGIGGVWVDPPVDLRLIKISAEQAWQLAKQQGLVGNSPFGEYRIELGDLKIDTPEPAHLAWLISGRNVAVSNGVDAGPTGAEGVTGPIRPGEAQPPAPPPCFFVTAGVAFDAVTGTLIGRVTGEPREP